MTKKKSKIDAVRRAILDLGIDFPGLSFVERDSLSTSESVSIHEVDRTPVFVDPELGAGDGIREKCFNSNGLDVGGKSVTSDEGKFTWKLSNFICEVGRLNVSEPACFVATARSNSPVFLTSSTVSVGDDLVIDVFSWDTSGNAAPNVRFSWRCWTDTPFIIE